MAEPILEGLTTAQREAVQHVEGPLLILAGPGSGKTRVLTHRVAHLVNQGVHPSMILALTFTNKAADEMKERVGRLVPDAHVWIGTFHRFCSRMLRRYADCVGLESNFTIYDTSDSRRALKVALESLKLPPQMTTPDRIANRISWLKNHMITAEAYTSLDDYELGPIIAEAYGAYQRELLSSNAVDFDDLLLHVVTLLQQSPELRASLDDVYRYVMVDEYQDTNLVQYAIVRSLSNDHPNLAVTGDPDQSIYGWRGANLNNILEFEADYPKVRVVRLEQNYRSTPQILHVADTLIANNVRRKRKELFTENAEGPPVQWAKYVSSKDEADKIVASIAEQIHSGRRPRDFAVFYRINALSRPFEHALREHGVPYQIVHGVEFYQRREVKDVLGYLHLIFNPQDNTALSRVINVPPRRIGKATLVKLNDYARSQGISLLEAARQVDQIPTLSKATRPRLRQFAELIDSIAARSGDSVEELLGLVLTETGYLTALKASDVPEDAERVANVEELLAAAREFDQHNAEPDVLGVFLEQASLVNDVDEWDEQNDRVTLMTLHAAKGLEFPVVYIIAVEQGILPHERSLNLPDQEEEERRLLFVGITRAQQQLQLSMAMVRSRRGGMSHTVPSQFLVELPRGEMEMLDFSRGSMIRTDADDDVSRQVTARRPDRPTSPAANIASLQTAAQMIAADSPESSAEIVSVDPASFEIGMTVVHPEYGPGKIAALSGQGKQRTGTINFVTAGQKKFVLAKSKVRPVNS